jgi:hypothetical protein
MKTTDLVLGSDQEYDLTLSTIGWIHRDENWDSELGCHPTRCGFANDQGQGGINAVDELLSKVSGLELVNGYLKIQDRMRRYGHGMLPENLDLTKEHRSYWLCKMIFRT